jgi:HK97 gp10 family phage protein
MSEFTAKVEGVRDFRAAVEGLVADLRRKVVRGALRDAARPIVRQAQADAPVLKGSKKGRLPGTLKRGIKVYSSKQKNGRNGVLGVYIHVKANKAALKRAGGKGRENPHDPYYWWWQEFGYTATGRRKLTGGTRRRNLVRNALVKTGRARTIPGKGFMRKAFADQQQEALQIFEQRIETRINRANQTK